MVNVLHHTKVFYTQKTELCAVTDAATRGDVSAKLAEQAKSPESPKLFGPFADVAWSRVQLLSRRMQK